MLRGSGRPEAYRLRDGTKVVGVTTILGRFKEAGGLLQWAFKQGQSGAATLYEKRDQSGDIGNLIHSMIEAEIHGTEAPKIPDAYVAMCDSGFGAYKEWFTSSKMEIVSTEMPYVSELYRFGGTIDAVGRDGLGRLCLIDWKSSGAVYTDYALQLAAYRQLWNENNPDQPIEDGGYHLCRFAKTHGDFEHRHFGRLDEAWEMFKLLVPAYDLDKKLRERIR